MELLKNFITEVRENDMFWLLEAKPGLFAMVEDNDENSYIPVWSSEAEAVSNISDDWEEYSVTNMNVAEFLGWMNELHEDQIGIAISTGNGGQMLPMPALTMKQLLKGLTVDAEEDKIEQYGIHGLNGRTSREDVMESLGNPDQEFSDDWSYRFEGERGIPTLRVLFDESGTVTALQYYTLQ